MRIMAVRMKANENGQINRSRGNEQQPSKSTLTIHQVQRVSNAIIIILINIITIRIIIIIIIIIINITIIIIGQVLS